MIKSIYLSIIGCLMIAFVTSCVKHEFDQPPVTVDDPNIVVNTTIAELKALHTPGNFEKITSDKVIMGVVIADDKSGNFYKTIIIQDNTGGIEVKINATSQYVKYPIGRRLFIKCNGLTLDDYNGTVQIGGSLYDNNGTPALGGIEQALVDTYILPGKYDQVVTPRSVKFSDLTNADVSTLVTLSDVEFTTGDAGKTYSDAVGKLTINLSVEDCINNTAVLRTSGYASFAADVTPNGKGTLTAVYSLFGSTKQLFIRDTRDVVFTGTRCGGSSGGVTPNTTIAQLKALHTGAFNVINTDLIIEGVITANDKSGNIYKELYIQDATGGMGVKVNLTNLYQTYSVGTKVAIKCNGLTLGDDSGTKLGGGTYVSTTTGKDLLGGLDAGQTSAAIVINGTGTPVAKSVSINGLTSDMVGNLIVLNDVEFVSGDVGQPYADAVNQKSLNRLVEDCNNNNITVRTSNFANFASSLTPGGKGQITGIYEPFGTTQQMIVRDASDATMTGPRCNGGTSGPGLDELDEDFETQVDKANVSIAGWYNVSQEGSRLWQAKYFLDKTTNIPNTYAQATAYKATSDLSNKMWLVTPGMNLSVAKTLSFESAKQVWVHDGLTVWISYDFTGSNASTATWTQIVAPLAKQSDADNVFVASGLIDLPVTTDKAYIGFKYTGDQAVNTTTYRIDNVKIKKK